jgi:hypothetical protein
MHTSPPTPPVADGVTITGIVHSLPLPVAKIRRSRCRAQMNADSLGEGRVFDFLYTQGEGPSGADTHAGDDAAHHGRHILPRLSGRGQPPTLGTIRKRANQRTVFPLWIKLGAKASLLLSYTCYPPIANWVGREASPAATGVAVALSADRCVQCAAGGGYRRHGGGSKCEGIPHDGPCWVWQEQ